MHRFLPSLLLAASLLPAAAHAQRDIARADSLLRAGRVEGAEAVYFAAAARRPRDPAARLALGRYLASRGATRVGAVLIEEAGRFGASPGLAAAHLAPLYSRLADWEALAKLQRAPLSAGERARAEWLVRNPSASTGPDSVTLPMSRDREVTIVVGTDTLRATIVPRTVGLVVDHALATSKSLRFFMGSGSDSRQSAALATRVQLGALELQNEPVRVETLGDGRAEIGMELLSRLSATVDGREGRLVLRRTGRLARGSARRVPLVLDPRESLVAWGGRLEPFGAVRVQERLAGTRWTVDGRRGELVVE